MTAKTTAGERGRAAHDSHAAAEDRVAALLAEQHSIYETLTSGIALLENRIVRNCNPNFASIFGYTPDELINQPTRILYPSEEDYRARAQDAYPDLVHGATSIHERRMRRKDGTLIWIASRLGPLDRNDIARGVVWAVDDITERRHAEQLLRLEHTVARSLAELDDDAAALRAVIRALCETQGWECGRYWCVDEAAGLLRFGAGWSVPSEDVERFVAGSHALTFAPGVGLAGAVWQSGEPLWIPDVTQDPRVSGRAVGVSIRGAFLFPVLSAGGVIGVINISSREVHAPDERLLQAVRVLGSQVGQFLHRRQAERVLRESEARFRNLTELSSDFYWEQDAEFRFTRFEGRRAGGGSGTLTEYLGKQHWEMGNEVDGGWEAHRELLAARQPFYDLVIRIADKSDKRRYVSVSGMPFYDSDGRFAGYRGVSTDITTRRREELMLRLEHTVASSLAEVDDTSAALVAAVRAVCETQHWECGTFWRVDQQANVLRFAESWSVPIPAIERFIEGSRDVTFALGAGLAGAAWESGTPIWVPDVRDDRRIQRKDMTRESGTHAAFVFPVAWNGKVIGVFTFSSFEIRAPDERLLAAVQMIGNQLGQFLQRKQAEQVLRESEARFRSLTELSSDWYWEQDAELRYTRMEGRQGGEQAQRMIGRYRWDGAAEIEGGWDAHRATLDARQPFYDVEMRTKSGRYLSMSGGPILDATGHFVGYRGVAREITERKRAEERIRYLATHDGLTGLPNRAMFSELLGRAIEHARRYQREFAVLFIDLDGFKTINDTFGHEAGDTLLKEIASRLLQTLRASDIVARLGGDEFVALVQEVPNAAEAAAVARKVLSAVIQPALIAGQESRVSASIGIARYPDDAEDEEALMRGADTAMYSAKQDGKNTFRFYSEDIKSQSLERLALESGLRRALERDEFLLHYQAKLDLKTGMIAGVEALLRWQHPDLGMVAPARFIPLAEETGLIVPIGRWVIKTACAQSVAWQRAGLPPVCMAVNVSARQFTNEKLLEDIATALRETGLAPGLLEIELTESVVVRNPERTADVLNAIKDLGVRIAIDDFGVGYSSLAQIKHYPVDTLKVDRSFIRDLEANSEDRAITKAIIDMGKTLGLTVVAEGVETRAQEDFLRDHSCDEMQGYFFNRPVANTEFATLLQQHLAAKRPKAVT